MRRGGRLPRPADKDVIGWLNECIYSMRRVGITEQEAHAAVRLSTVDLHCGRETRYAGLRAEVLDMQDVIGSLSPGKKADLLIIDSRAPNFAPRWNWLNQIVFNGRPENVEYVFVNGKVRKAEGRVLDMSAVDLGQEVDAAAQRIKAVLQP
jgi:hypothetical protein